GDLHRDAAGFPGRGGDGALDAAVGAGAADQVDGVEEQGGVERGARGVLGSHRYGSCSYVGRSGGGRGGAQRVQGRTGEHVGDVAAEGVDLPDEGGGDVGPGRVGEQEDGVDVGEVVVHPRHRLLVGEVELGAQSAHHGLGA